jgi:hypothetical protein
MDAVKGRWEGGRVGNVRRRRGKDWERCIESEKD